MLDSFKFLKSGQVGQVDSKLMFPLLRWSSGSLIDLPWCQEVNKYFFGIPNDIAKVFLAAGLKDRNPYIKYPKSVKETSDKTFELKKHLVCKYYGWSDQEFKRNINIVTYIDWLLVANALGIDNKERKMLGLDKLSFKKVAKKSSKPAKSLFDF